MEWIVYGPFSVRGIMQCGVASWQEEEEITPVKDAKTKGTKHGLGGRRGTPGWKGITEDSRQAEEAGRVMQRDISLPACAENN